MKKPNFFILGAPKCGTTSLAAWLSQHPQIFMSPLKEPFHFNTDHNNRGFKERSHYESLFSKADDRHIAVGEASAWYLSSQVAVSLIEEYSPESRYVVCLRNPVDMAYSLHEQQLVSGNEHVKCFSEAWELSDERLKASSVSRWCADARQLAYGEVCKLGAQMGRLYDRVPKSRVLPVFLDDLRSKPDLEYQRIVNFLGVRSESQKDFPVLNSAKELRSVRMRKVVTTLGTIKYNLGIKGGIGLLNFINRKNVTFRDREPMSEAMRIALQDYFREDVIVLGNLVGRDLSDWLKA